MLDAMQMTAFVQDSANFSSIEKVRERLLSFN
jgi:hypothetical protein